MAPITVPTAHALRPSCGPVGSNSRPRRREISNSHLGVSKYLVHLVCDRVFYGGLH